MQEELFYSMIKCSNCSKLNKMDISPYIIGCIGKCNKVNEYCTGKDGCTFGKVSTNYLITNR